MMQITAEQVSNLTINQKLELISLLEAKVMKKASGNLIRFTQATYQKFDLTWFHEKYYQKLDDFSKGKIKKLMVFMPPQHGKSEGSTRRLPSFMLGRNPDSKIAVLCYNAGKAAKFNREIQRIMLSPEYGQIFPDIQLANRVDGYSRTQYEFELPGYNGGLKAVGVGGALTGEPVDILIMDDLYKDAQEAYSPTRRETIEEWYDTVAETRLHNDSQQLLVFTRWHENDLAGRLLKTEKDWEVIKFEAIKTTPPSEFDPRHVGEPLYPSKHNLQKLLTTKNRNPQAFQSLYQGDPKPKEGYLYNGIRTYQLIPITESSLRKNYTDTADTGADFLCSIDYVETEEGMFVTDVLYTDAAMEVTEPGLAMQLLKNKTQICRVESNNGGRGFGRNVERQTKLLKNYGTTFKPFTQTENKAARIFSHSAEVINMIYMPANWETMWPDFYAAVTGYMKTGNNAHDDAADVLTGMTEWFGVDDLIVGAPDWATGFL